MKTFTKSSPVLLLVLLSGIFSLTVTGQSKIVNVNLYDNNDPYNNTQWNNQLITQTYPYTSAVYKYNDGTSSTIYSTISANQAIADNGAGYATTMCPSSVGRYASYYSTTRTITFKGLNNAKFYDIQLYCSRSTAQGTTRNVINGVTVDIAVYNNFTNIATFSNIAPSGGQIVLTQLVLNSYVYLNGFTITEKGSAANQAPTANAGTSQTIALPTSTVSLSGSGTDADGTIASYAWSQVSGTAATITSPSSASTTISGLTTSGVRVFRLTVTDNLGATGTSDVTITVNSANTAPTANAGTNQTIALPTSTVSLSGSGTDVDGTIASYTWSQVSGTAATITSPSLASTTISGLTTSGVRVFRLTVTDNQGATGTSDVTVTVNGANVAPTANAGTNQIIALPTSTVTLSGTGTDADGTIASYAWTQISGTAATITSASSSSTTITGLTTTGVRVFRLTVTDNQGATGTADITITVNAASSSQLSNVINVNLYDNNDPYSSTQWNNQLITQTYPYTSAVYKYGDGSTSTIYSTISGNQAIADNGAGYATTMCPAAVGRYASYYPATRTITFKGLNNAKFYTIQLYCTRSTSQGTTRNTINGVNVDIPVYNNFTNIATFSDVPPAGGQIVLTQAVMNSYVYLNGFTITEKTAAGNQAPTANAGTNQTIQLPTSTVSLSGSGTDADGTIASYAWSQVSGTAGTITTPSSATTTITGLTTAGVRIFRLTVTDNQGATGTSDVTITVNGANVAPTANAGSNQTITLPVTSLTLTGSGSDADGTIASYAWSQVSGTAATIASASSASTTITGLISSGVRVFRLTVTDNLGATGTSDVTVTVNPNAALPYILTNDPQTITTTSASLSSSGAGNNGIASTKWTKFTVPGQTIKKLTVVGSSTAAGNGATVSDSSFVNRLKAYYTAQGIISTITNLAVAGSDIFGLNITNALNTNPDVVLMSFPSNGYPYQTIAAATARYQEIADSCTNRGIVLYISGTQPRNDYSVSDRQKLVTINDSLRLRFPTKFIDFLTPINNTTDNTIKPEYNSGDGIHPNNAGHKVLFDKVVAANIFKDLISSPSVIVSPAANNSSITSLPNGVNQFQVSIIDNAGFAASAVAKITVNTAPNQAPVANAGTNQIIILPTSTTSLTGSGTDADGTIASYAWSQLTGATVTINNISSASTTITGLTLSGVYTFRLTVTDNSGATGTSDVTVTVNQAPTANAGASQTITLPTSTVSLAGVGTDTDGTIASYGWTQVSGTAATISSPASASVIISGLSTSGIRVFRLTVTDNLGATAISDLTVTVRESSILNPADSLYAYNSSSPPVQPAIGQIGKWVRTPKMTWSTDSWKAYIINTLAFRLKFPRSYNPTAIDGKKYPLIIFMHGKGEVSQSTGNINYDNEFSLANGGPVFTSAVDNGSFDGYVLVAQAPPSGWTLSHTAAMVQIIDYMILNNKLDPFQVVVNGLSDGAFNLWETTNFKPSYIAARFPMSGIGTGNIADTTNLKYTPIWDFQGGLDTHPDPYTCQQVKTAYNSVGANFKSTLYPDLGHDTWDRAWTEPDFFPSINRAYMSNPWPLFGRTDFCPGDSINVNIGVNPGFDAYEWRKDGVLISGAITNSIQATQTGIYDARVLKGTAWSEWSRIPVQIKIKAATVSPVITVSGLMSKVIPALDTNKVTLKVPAGYVSYVWQKVGNTSTISTDSALVVTSPGDYIVKVTELYGCSSSFGTPFTVVNANGINNPSPAAGLIVSTASKTSLKLDWSQNPSPQYNETNFEVYQASQAGGTYKLVAIVPADTTTATITGLNPKTTYYYKVRAVNNTSAAAASNEASGVTSSDTQAPTAPSGLTITSTSRSAVSLSWTASTDDVAVTGYDVYVNGIKSYTTTQTIFTVNDLQYSQSYNFTVKAKDFAGNVSPASNQVTGQPLLTGFNYKYYTYTGTWNNLPDFNTLTPVATGTMPNISIVPRTQEVNYAFLWQGYISIPTTGTYYFRTNSDDGSKLYLGALNATNSPYSFSGTAIVNNDGSHTGVDVTSVAQTLTAGVYPIAVTYFQGVNSESITVSWSTPSTGGSFVTIPDNAFTDAAVVNGSAPAAPSTLVATTVSYKQINLSWTDNSNNETGFEIWRSTNSSTGFVTVGAVAANSTIYSDSSLIASTTYYYKIRAIGQYGESAFSGNASATTLVTPDPPIAPANLLATATSPSIVNITWTQPAPPPTANAGSNQTIALPTSQVTLTGSAVANNGGSITGYAWTQVSGTAATITNASSASTTVTALTTAGTRVFRLTVTDNQGGTGTSDVTITVNSASPPTANAGSNQTITLPVSAATLSGSGTANNGGTIASYAWTQVSGTAATITTPSSATTTVTGLTTSGIYTFKLTVADNQGSTGNSTVTITVNPISNGKTIAGRIEAESWDSKIGYQYAATTTDAGGGYKMVGISTSSSLDYNVTVVTTGNYTVSFRIATPQSGTQFLIKLGSTVLGTANIPTTGGWDTWNTFSITNVPLTAGSQTLRILSNGSGNCDFNWMEFALTSGAVSGNQPVTTSAGTSGATTLSATSTSGGSTTITGYELYRSSNNNSNYLLLKTLPANTVSYVDTGLFSNAIYYYKVRAIGAGNNSGYSNEDSAITKNNAPALTAIANQSIYYQSTAVVNVQANDPDAEYLTLAVTNLPAFGSFQQTASGLGQITFAPNGIQGVYNNISVTVTDQHGGSNNIVFNLTANNNYNPVVDSISNYTLNESDSLNIPLSASDQNAGDVLSWSVANAPAGTVITAGANRTAVLGLHPGYAAAGVYTVMVNVNDGNGGNGTRQFTLTVNDRNPNTRIYTRIKYANDIGTPWNNITGITSTNLKDEYNNTTAVGLSFQQPFWMPYNAGPVTGNNSGVYPDAVLNDFWYFGYYGGPETAAVAVTGLNPAKKYNLTFYAGSVFGAVSDNGTTTYTVGAQTVSLYVQNNTQNTVSINNITPAANGTITVNMAKGANTPIGYLNALVLTSVYDDGTVPVAATSLTAQNVSGQGVKLNWNDVSYNETGYEVYRSATAAGTYTLVGTTGPDAVTYTDGTVSGSTLYYYKVRAINSYGASAYTAVVSITTINRIPQLTAISDVNVKTNQTATVNVTAVDDATDHIRLTATGLPSFATFTDNGNGTGVVNIVPTAGSLGVYTGITITAKDNSDSSRSVSFSIYVTDANITSTYVNISDLNNTASAPWNNMGITYLPYAGTAISNLKDDGNVNTGITVTLTDAWQGVSTTGMRRRNGSELYPESVSRAGIYFTDAATHRITVSGLDPAKKYNFVFYNSHGFSESTLTNFTVGSQTVSLDGSYNSNKTAQVNGIVPAANGQVVINCAKDANAISGLLSALVIQSYTPGAVATYGPSDLRILDYNATNTISLQWQDRADNETGYEVWRANDGGSYALLASLAANTTSYVNTGLTANTTYNYIVRAKNGANYSAYSNTVRGYTYGSTVFININSNSVAASPWNNLNWVYGLGAVWNNFKNETGIPTNTGMSQPAKIDGMVSPGVNTGNNSGIFPDNVMAEGFGMFPGLSTYIKITGLNLSKTYDFTLFASITGVYGDNSTAYTINGKTCLLNAINNKSGTLTMFGIAPDQNGEVTISFTTTTGATYALLGAVVIKGYDKSSNPIPAIPSSATADPGPVTTSFGRSSVQTDSSSNTTQQLVVLSRTATSSDSLVADAGIKELSAYPNPFKEMVTVSVPSKGNEDISVTVSDMSGREVYSKQYSNLVKGNNNIKIADSQGMQNPGMYLVRITYKSTGEQKILKIIKQ